MAEFCKQCAEELGFPPDFTNLFINNNEVPDGIHGYYMLCETCGPQCFIVDDEGTCGSRRCMGSLEKGNPHGG